MINVCTKCHQQFSITDEDIAFYDKVSPIVNGQKFPIPTPTLCPPCREQRRMSFRNERQLYNRHCDLSQKQIISLYAPDSTSQVYETSLWWSDQWDALDYGRDFDFSRPFFSQFQELLRAVPRMSLNTMQNENSDFTSFAGYNKNCYLIHTADENQDCYYGVYALSNKDCVDFLFTYNSELCYEVADAHKCYRVFWGKSITNCYDSYFIQDCVGCHDLIMCIGMRNKSFCFKNKQYSEADYKVLKAEFLTNLCQKIDQYKEEFQTLVLQSPHQAVHILSSENCTGDFIQNSRNLENCFDISKAENCKYSSFIVDCKDSYDWTFYSTNGQLGYELANVATNVYHCLFSMNCWVRSTSLMYCDLCQSCQDCFGCVGLRNKQYCIFNKQYSKEQYEVLVQKIITHMISTKEWGEFFPSIISPFAYNETVAQEYYPQSKEQVESSQLAWRDIASHNRYEGPKVSLPKDIKDISDTITKEILTCSNCSKNYRLIQQELNYYRNLNIPAPDRCFNCRHQSRVNSRNGRKLYARNCNQCQVPLQTTYAPDRPEKIYCESCYLTLTI